MTAKPAPGWYEKGLIVGKVEGDDEEHLLNYAERFPERALGDEPEDVPASHNKDNKDALHHHHQRELQLYGRRWYVLSLFALLACLQSAEWNFYSPISTVIQRVYKWDTYLVEWAANTAGLVYTVIVCGVSILADRWGNRRVVVVAAICACLCAGLRLLPVPIEYHSYLVITSMVFNGVAAAPIGLCPPGISAAWFPARQRTLATAIATTSNYFGQAVGFFLGPAMVPDDGPARHAQHGSRFSSSSGNNSASSFSAPLGNKSNSTAPNATSAADYEHIQKLYWTHFGVAAAVAVLIIAYWPERPPKPPSTSASLPRTDLCNGFGKLLAHRRFWAVCVSFAVPSGWFSGWLAALDINLEGLGFEEVTQSTSSQIGTLQIVGGVVAGLVSSALMGTLFKRKLKAVILAMYVGAFLSFSAFAVLCQCWKARLLPFSMPALYVTTILGGMFLNGTIPLFYELAMETVYPIPEGGAAGLLMLSQNALQSVFLAVPTSRIGGVMWMNWTLAGTLPLFTVLMWLFKEQYLRSDIDE